MGIRIYLNRKGDIKMKRIKKAGIMIAGVVVVAGIVWGLCGKKVKMLHTSLNSFKDEKPRHHCQDQRRPEFYGKGL